MGRCGRLGPIYSTYSTFCELALIIQYIAKPTVQQSCLPAGCTIDASTQQCAIVGTGERTFEWIFVWSNLQHASRASYSIHFPGSSTTREPTCSQWRKRANSLKRIAEMVKPMIIYYHIRNIIMDNMRTNMERLLLVLGFCLLLGCQSAAAQGWCAPCWWTRR